MSFDEIDDLSESVKYATDEDVVHIIEKALDLGIDEGAIASSLGVSTYELDEILTSGYYDFTLPAFRKSMLTALRKEKRLYRKYYGRDEY